MIRALRSAGAPGFTLAALLIAAGVLAPVVALLAIGAQGSGDLWPHLIAYVLPPALANTAILLGGVAAVVAVVGVGSAWLIATTRFPGRDLLEWALLLPLAMPTYIIAYAYLDVMHPIGPIQTAMRALLGISDPAQFHLPEIRSTWGAILLLGFVLYPYVYLPARATFLMQSAPALEVARTLGARRGEIFFRIALPLARPAIIVGAALALLEALNDIGASEFLGVRTLTVSIYSTWLNRSSLPGAAQISLLMLAVVIALFLLERWARRNQRFAGSTRRAQPVAPVQLTGIHAAAALLSTALPVFIGFVVPALHLASQAVQNVSANGISMQLFAEARNTLLYAALATAVTIGLGVAIAYAVRSDRSALSATASKVASLGYAIPGTVLAVGLLWPLAAFDNSIDALMRQAFGISTGLILSGSGAALVLAYSIRFLAVSVNGIEAGYEKIPLSIDHAARSLGETSLGAMRRVHLPILRPAIAAAAILVFVDCMKELPATLMLRPFGVETLATHIYAEAVRGTYEDGSVAALAIVLVGLAPVLLLARLIRNVAVVSTSPASDQLWSAGISR